jgi:hypothetical protein
MPPVIPYSYRHRAVTLTFCIDDRGGVVRCGRRTVKCHGLAAWLCDDVTLHQTLLPEHATAAVSICFKPLQYAIRSIV